MSRRVEALYVLTLLAFAHWAGSDQIVNGKEILLLLGVCVYIAWVKVVGDWEDAKRTLDGVQDVIDR